MHAREITSESGSQLQPRRLNYRFGCPRFELRATPVGQCGPARLQLPTSIRGLQEAQGRALVHHRRL